MSSIADQPLLSVRNLTVRGPHGTLVRDVSFEVPRGEVLALVGESGAGKSMTTLAVLGLLAPGLSATGNIDFHPADGPPIDLLTLTPQELRRFRLESVGVVFQNPSSAFDPVHTVGAQIGEVLAARGLPRTQRMGRVTELLARVRLADPERVARSYPHQVSGGQLQRAMIAMALAHEPVLIIADEPTTALDALVQREILDLLRELRAETGSSTLLITHDMGVVADSADRVAVMLDGQIVEQGDVKAVLGQPKSDYTRTLVDAVARLDGTTVAGRREFGEAIVTVNAANVTYRGRPNVVALHDVSLTVPAGQMVAFVGESGAGKSTLGRVIAGLEPLTSGSASVAGVDLPVRRAAGRRALGAKVGIVFQNPALSLNPEHTVRRSVELPLRIHTDLSPAARVERVNELLAEVGLGPEFALRRPRELSGGQQQRVAIARALALDPDVLIADEPTSSLDARTQRDVLALLSRIRQHRGLSGIIITHDFSVAEAVADRIVVLRNGEVVEDGPTATVLRAPAHDYTRALIAAVPLVQVEGRIGVA
ncbi:nickel ABC transporter ATP-binding protein NikE [Nocardia camponoti]|uniref:Oligopeptide ABC transporter, ATP-binding protein n=1 Tax=Nocardia camponoti TaxID=1616106 RepID=A0A917QRJ6_9NOCA|nr:ABC transporter ATP-binding protein [Nocardia camponoti]GGK65056.1 putative oligopeptide ABC transporter, ATP-binding protein [Nocardia camponoti]